MLTPELVEQMAKQKYDHLAQEEVSNGSILFKTKLCIMISVDIDITAE